jgi:hypothetical protein
MTDAGEPTQADKILAGMQTMFPREFQIVLLTVDNERLRAELAAAAEHLQPTTPEATP